MVALMRWVINFSRLDGPIRIAHHVIYEYTRYTYRHHGHDMVMQRFVPVRREAMLPPSARLLRLSASLYW